MTVWVKGEGCWGHAPPQITDDLILLEEYQIESAASELAAGLAISSGGIFVFECLDQGKSPSHILDLSHFQEENSIIDL